MKWTSHNILLINLGLLQTVLCSSVNTLDAPPAVEETLNVTKTLDRILKDYDKYERPFIGAKPLEIGVRFLVTNINHVSEENMEFQMSVDIVQQWTDPRLAYNKRSKSAMFLSADILNKIWLPDTSIHDVRRIEVDAGTVTAMIFGNGTVDYAYRAVVTVVSLMHFQDYPMDHQTLYIKLFSYRYTVDKIKYKSLDGTGNFAHVVGFIVEKYEKTTGSEVFPSGEYSYLILSITVHRRLGYFLMQFYFPCILCAVVSWLPFWMDRYEIGDRVSMGITTLLTEVFLSQYINSAMPRVSYIKAADEFTLASFLFIFLALMEHVIVYAVREDNKENEQGQRSCHKEPAAENLSIEIAENEIQIPAAEDPKKEIESRQNGCSKKVTDRSLLVDKISRVLFPLSYVTLVFIYFSFELQDVYCYAQEISPSEELTDSKRNNLGQDAPFKTADRSGNADEKDAKEKNQALVMDQISRVLFPLIFIVFQAYYLTIRPRVRMVYESIAIDS